MKTTQLGIFFLLITNFLLPNDTHSQSITGGTNHSIALCGDGSVRTWGLNMYGQCGNGSTNTIIEFPEKLNSLKGIIAIAGAGQNSYAIKSTGTLWAWGYNNNGQLGNGTYANSNVPVQVSSITNIIAVAGGAGYALALKGDGTVWAWGYNFYGQLGNGTNTNSNVPVQVNSLSNIIAIAAGQDHALALKNDGTVWAWGANAYGQLGIGMNTNTNIAVQVSGISNISSIAAGGSHSIVLKSDATVWTWGRNDVGQLGNGTNTSSNTPAMLSSLSTIKAIVGGGGIGNCLALKKDGTVWAWGYNFFGQLGNETFDDSNVPVKVSKLSGVTAISGGENHCFAIKNDATVWAWGNDGSGQLAQGIGFLYSEVPIEITDLCKEDAVATNVNDVSETHSIASVYPNPSNGKFNFTELVNDSYRENENLHGESFGQIEIYDVTGRLILQTISKNNFCSIDLSNNDEGIYFVKCTSATKSSTQKVIIQK